MAPKEMHSVLKGFCPAVAKWFGDTFDQPSPAQIKGWPLIRRGENTLLLAPTGSGKTLAAFLCAIDSLCKQDTLEDGIQVLYISPLKALGNDIHKNLIVPLEGIRKRSKSKIPDIRVAVRTGDTPQNERAKMVRHPPNILITTPESLYLLLGSRSMDHALRNVRTVIVDEIHAICDNKRGVHLAVSLERLQNRTDIPIQRIGCSATIHPLEDVASFLVGNSKKGTQRACKIVDAGMRKNLDIKVMAPLPDFLAASNTALWASAYELLLAEIRKHRTTLIFCNSRYKAERTALHLNELAAGECRIGVHHGSLSKEQRLEMEEKLKSGELEALVATASLELGIDIGSIDLVYQLESSKSIATGAQRIGRAGHLVNATSKGRFLIFERDELFEAAVICKSIGEGRIDAIQLPRNCLDVLAQQIAGAVACWDWKEDELFDLIRLSFPYHDLSHDDYDRVLDMLAGDYPFEMARPPWALILRDRVSGTLSAARGAKQTCSMCVGTIPDNADYEVVIEATKKRVGKVHSEFVDDSLRTGDVFVLGSSSWKIQGKRKNQLLVAEAPGATPTVPWWTGPIAPRTPEVGEEVGLLRNRIAHSLDDTNLPALLGNEYSLGNDAAAAMTDYVREQVSATGMVPDHSSFLVETWIDELGQTNIIIHCPLGQRINKTWGIGLSAYAQRELQQMWNVTATNDLILLAYSSDKKNWRKPVSAEKLLTVAPSKILKTLAQMGESMQGGSSSFREVAACALQIRRADKGRRVPMWLQNHRAEELYTACEKSESYPINREIQRAYLEEALDIGSMRGFLESMKSKKVRLVFKDVESPSPFSHALLVQDVYRSSHQMGRDRRAHLLRLHRKVLQEVLTSDQVAQLLDVRAIEKIETRLTFQSEVSRARTSEELAHAIRALGAIPATMDAVSAIVDGDPAKLLAPLIKEHRILAFRFPDSQQTPFHLVAADLWRQYHDAFATKKTANLRAHVPVLKQKRLSDFKEVSAKTVISPKWLKKQPAELARRRIVERYMKYHGAVTLYDLMNHTGWPKGVFEEIFEELTNSGTVVSGVYDGERPRPQWINKVNLEEVHRLTLGYLKRELAACAPYEVVDFMTRWQHRHPSTRLKGLNGLREVIHQLQGIEVVSAALETELLPTRVSDYEPSMLDKLISSGEVCWRRVDCDQVKRGKIALCLRSDMEWVASGADLTLYSSRGYELSDQDIREDVLKVRDYFKKHQTAFFDDLLRDTKLDEDTVLRAVWFLCWCGEIICDTYESIRHGGFQTTLSDCYDLANTSQKIVRGRIPAELVVKHIKSRKLDPRLGRWTATERLIPPHSPIPRKEVINHWANLLLTRWGVVSRDMVDSEVCAPSWGELVPAFKRMELLGKLNRGYFIEHHHGEQYGLPEAVELLRDCRARRSDGQELGYIPDEPVFSISSRDPANLYSYSLDIIDDSGGVLQRTQKRGNLLHSMLIQAGQVLIFGKSWDARQLVALDATKLSACIELMKGEILGNDEQLHLRRWNGHPIDMSPVSKLLWQSGFRFNSRGELCWPPPRKPSDTLRAVTKKQKEYLPYYSEPSPIEYNAEWLISRTSEPLQNQLKQLLELLRTTLPPGVETCFGQDTFNIPYKGKDHIHARIQKTRISLHIRHRGWVPPITIMPDTDIDDPQLISAIVEQVARCRKAIDAQAEKKPSS